MALRTAVIGFGLTKKGEEIFKNRLETNLRENFVPIYNTYNNNYFRMDEKMQYMVKATLPALVPTSTQNLTDLSSK